MSLASHSGQTHLEHPKYRPDIDGLRAIAVLSVVGFHAFPTWIRGGFVGVDIFFVISGYLITSIILTNLNNGTFSFSEFYSRRIKRIFPALIVVMTTCLIFGWYALLPHEYKQLGKHLAAGAGFVSNLFFWQEAGYFDNAAESKPLLHLWSLGIEEQFYILWPLLIYFAVKQRLNVLVLALAIVLISFSFNVSIRLSDRVQDFYSPLTRFWELMLGSILAYLVSRDISPVNSALRFFWFNLRKVRSEPNVPEALLANIQSGLGLLLIGTSVLLVTPERLFPGWWASLPTLGAFLIISAGQNSWLNRVMLSHGILVWFGLISYPLYLWHWPLLSFAMIMESKTPTIGVRLLAIALALVLAWITFRMIEHPFRFGRHHRAKTLSLLLLMIVLAAMGYHIYGNDGILERKLDDKMTESHSQREWAHCEFQGKKDSHCLTMDPSRPPDTVLIGDSHAHHLQAGLLNSYKTQKNNITILWGGDCLPFFEDIGRVNFPSNCDSSFINHALEEAIHSASIERIILAGYGVAKIQGRGESTNRSEDYANNPSIDALRKNSETFKRAMYRTIDRLVMSGKQVAFIVDVPEMYFDPMQCVSRPLELPGHKIRKPCAVSRQKFEARNNDFHRIIQEARERFPMVKFVDAYQYLCDQELCYGSINGELLYKDRDHLNSAGSRYLLSRISDELMK